MRLPRMTTRRWMVAVALVALLIVTIQWHAKWTGAYLWMANEHARQKAIRTIPGGPGKATRVLDIRSEVMSVDRERWHAAMAAKYRRAAYFPWLPVEPDPPKRK
jgi:hypothetical protein